MSLSSEMRSSHPSPAEESRGLLSGRSPAPSPWPHPGTPAPHLLQGDKSRTVAALERVPADELHPCLLSHLPVVCLTPPASPCSSAHVGQCVPDLFSSKWSLGVSSHPASFTTPASHLLAWYLQSGRWEGAEAKSKGRWVSWQL